MTPGVPDVGPNSVTLHLTRTFAAPRERVYRAWTEQELLSRWYWPDPVIEIDARQGGTYHFSDRRYGVSVRGEFLEVSPPERLSYTWRWDGEDATTLVTVEFLDKGETTEVRLTHQGFGTDEDRTNHEQGWNDCIDRLELLLSDPEPQQP